MPRSPQVRPLRGRLRPETDHRHLPARRQQARTHSDRGGIQGPHQRHYGPAQGRERAGHRWSGDLQGPVPRGAPSKGGGGPSRLRRHALGQPKNAGGLRRAAARRRGGEPPPDPRGERHGKGAARPRDPRPEPWRQGAPGAPIPRWNEGKSMESRRDNPLKKRPFLLIKGLGRPRPRTGSGGRGHQGWGEAPRALPVERGPEGQSPEPAGSARGSGGKAMALPVQETMPFPGEPER